jgi:ribose 5-phosphate isomerase A
LPAVARQDEQKRVAAEAAAAEVSDGMRVGLGTGSTAAWAVRALGARVAKGLRIVGVPTSRATEALAREVGIPLGTLDEEPALDVTIDGADEVDPALRLVKGGGGALLREKIVASATRRLLIVVDASKWRETLGAFPLPVEVVPFGATVVARRLAELGCVPARRRAKDGKPFVTDEGNHILDCPFGRIEHPERLATALASIPGVVEHGLFLGMTYAVYVAGESGVRVVRAPAR